MVSRIYREASRRSQARSRVRRHRRPKWRPESRRPEQPVKQPKVWPRVSSGIFEGTLVRIFVPYVSLRVPAPAVANSVIFLCHQLAVPGHKRPEAQLTLCGCNEYRRTDFAALATMKN